LYHSCNYTTFRNHVGPYPLITQIYKFTKTTTCCNTKQPHVSPKKLLTLIKFLQWTQRRAQLKHVDPTKTGAEERFRFITQGLLFPHPIPNSAPQPSSNLRPLPRAVGLEGSSHGLTQSKMLTNFHTFRHENTRSSTLPIKFSTPIYNKSTKKLINNYKT